MIRIVISVYAEVPDNATWNDINDWVNVKYSERHGMKLEPDNPCINGSEVDTSWDYYYDLPGKAPLL